MRVAGRELVVICIKAAPASNETDPKAPTSEKAEADAPAVDNEAEPHPEAIASS